MFPLVFLMLKAKKTTRLSMCICCFIMCAEYIKGKKTQWITKIRLQDEHTTPTLCMTDGAQPPPIVSMVLSIYRPRDHQKSNAQWFRDSDIAKLYNHNVQNWSVLHPWLANVMKTQHQMSGCSCSEQWNILIYRTDRLSKWWTKRKAE